MSVFYRATRDVAKILGVMAVFAMGVVTGRLLTPQITEGEIWADYLKTKRHVQVARYVSHFNEPELRSKIIDLLGWTVPNKAPLVIACIEDAEE